MIPIVRFYANAKNAEQAVKHLKADGFDSESIYHLKPSGEGEGDADPADRVAQEVDAGRLPKASQAAVTQALGQSRHVVSVYVTYGRGRPAVRILEDCDPVELEALPESYSNLEGARLMSEVMGIPMISQRRHYTISSSTGLAGFRFVFGNVLGLGLTSGKAAPLSDTVGLKTVYARKKDWKTSLGLPLQANDAAPLSSKLGMKTVLERKKAWTSSFGLPLQASSSAPFSNALGLPVLTEKKR
jgi:hypothetical protein